MTDDKIIEALARAIEPETFNLPRINLNRAIYDRAYAKARAATEAVSAAGYWLAPMEATEEMLEAAWEEVSHRQVYRRMRDAALRARQTQNEGM